MVKVIESDILGDEKPKNTKAGELIFFNSIRILMVICVVIFHAACSYVPKMVPFWPYHNPEESLMLDVVIAFFDVFMMPTLFFISGFFSLLSLKKYGGKKFILGKIKRLFLPWLITILLVLPSLDYMFYYYYSTNDSVAILNYFQYLTLCFQSFLNLKVGYLDMSQYVPMKDQIYLRYMWFLSLLMVFSLILVLIYRVKGKLSNYRKKSVLVSQKSKTKLLIVVGTLISLGFFIIDLLTMGNGISWFSLGNFINFQPSKVILYGGFFTLGIYGYSREWWFDGKPIGKWRWITIFLFIATPLVGREYIRSETPLWWLQLLFAITFCFLALAILIGLTNIGLKRWNKKDTFLNRNLAPHSYNIYLLHYILVLVFQLFLGNITFLPELKWIIVIISSILLSFALSRYVLKPITKKLRI